MGEPQLQNLHLTRVGAVATLTLDRPRALNALDAATLRELARAIRDVRRMGEDHLRAKVRAGRWTVDAVAFGRGPAVEAAQTEERLDLVFTLRAGLFGGDRGGVLQLELRDFASVDIASTIG